MAPEARNQLQDSHPSHVSKPASLVIPSNYPSRAVLDQPIFKHQTASLTEDESISLSYHRARALAKVYSKIGMGKSSKNLLISIEFTLKDVLQVSPKFWQLHRDPISAVDGGLLTLFSIQMNLAAGTLAPFAAKRKDLQPLMQKILNFDVSWVDNTIVLSCLTD